MAGIAGMIEIGQQPKTPPTVEQKILPGRGFDGMGCKGDSQMEKSQGNSERGIEHPGAGGPFGRVQEEAATTLMICCSINAISDSLRPLFASASTCRAIS